MLCTCFDFSKYKNQKSEILRFCDYATLPNVMYINSSKSKKFKKKIRTCILLFSFVNGIRTKISLEPKKMAGRVWDRDKHFLHNVCIIFSDKREATTVVTTAVSRARQDTSSCQPCTRLLYPRL